MARHGEIIDVGNSLIGVVTEAPAPTATAPIELMAAEMEDPLAGSGEPPAGRLSTGPGEAAPLLPLWGPRAPGCLLPEGHGEEVFFVRKHEAPGGRLPGSRVWSRVWWREHCVPFGFPRLGTSR